MTSTVQSFASQEFGTVRTVEIDGEPWLVGKDVATVLGYGDTAQAIRKHVDDEDKGVVDLTTPGGMQKTTIINESGLYSLVLSSKLPSAKKFRRWVTSEVLPSIRKTGGYNLPKDYPSALRALADAEEKRMQLESANKALSIENAEQKQAIADFEPVKHYVDVVLSSDNTMTTTQIGADYDLSAKALNQILHEDGVQHKVNGQWILYKKHMGKGYTKSITFEYKHKDGTPDFKLHTQWTQKGRLMIHSILTKRGIMAVMDKELLKQGYEPDNEPLLSLE